MSEKCIYELLCEDSYNADMRMNYKPPKIIARYMNKKKAEEIRDKYNYECNWGRPYFIREVKLDE